MGDRRYLWLWNGQFFGYWDGDQLRDYAGKHVGKFYGDEIYSQDGLYLGEIRFENRLISKKCKKGRRKSPFVPAMSKMSIYKRMNHSGRMMLTGHVEFDTHELNTAI